MLSADSDDTTAHALAQISKQATTDYQDLPTPDCPNCGSSRTMKVLRQTTRGSGRHVRRVTVWRGEARCTEKFGCHEGRFQLGRDEFENRYVDTGDER